MAYQDKFVEVDGLKLRYIEEGSGPSLLFLHGASLGSSADVFLRNLGPFAKAGFRAAAFDLPGFGLSDIPAKQSVGQQRNSISKFIDAAGLGKTALIAHSRSGGFAMQLALEDPSRYSHVIILGTGSLLPLQTEAQVGRYEAVQARVDKEMAQTEPTLEDARKLLQADTFNHALISEEDVAVPSRESDGSRRLPERGRKISDRISELRDRDRAIQARFEKKLFRCRRENLIAYVQERSSSS